MCKLTNKIKWPKPTFGKEHLLILRVPHIDEAIDGAGGQQPAIRAVAHTHGELALRALADLALPPARLHAPHVHPARVAARRNAPAVRRQRQRPRVRRRRVQHIDRLAALDVEDADPRVERTGDREVAGLVQVHRSDACRQLIKNAFRKYAVIRKGLITNTISNLRNLVLIRNKINRILN